ncbi:carbohydrate ABC transporter permease [Paenibacillus arenilitoris]|uniref:Carbohydrate ABC transporter permease n=1 Tax=Paenibacillus arenilitoris TaxID=2772299 RepID=A0A927CVE2_9BACL|nr:carbohydrate ABC transporter permease [Paenibacillus arenilitoris]MBD2872531.1 carbohydrate ABC transporter permease [Paenibacillus arenilitoris]
MGAKAQTAKRRYYKGLAFQEGLRKTVVAILLIGGSVIILSPIWWMISTSLKPMEEIMQYPPTFFPKEIHWDNYVRAWTSPAAHFSRWLMNTALITVCVVLASVFSNAFIAYGFAKIKFPGRSFLFAVVLATMMIPGFVTMIPQYILFAKLGWMNTYWPLIVPSLFGSAFFIFLLRQFFMSIPNELIDAAKIDGANHFYIWLRLMVPLIKPAVATIAIFSFNGAWNDFLGPLLYVNDEKMYTLQIGLQTFKGTEATQWHYLMAASLMVLLPVIALFMFFQRYFIEGMNLTAGTKG